MHEQPPGVEDQYLKGVKRILSDTALVKAGAVFDHDRLVVPEDYIEQLAQESESTQSVPQSLLLSSSRTSGYPRAFTPWEIRTNLETASSKLVEVYKSRRLLTAVEQFDPNQPATYLQAVRDLIQQASHDERQSTTYKLGDSSVTSLVTGDMNVVTADMQRILPHRELVLFHNGWYDKADRLPHYTGSQPQFPLEDGFIKHALALYGITERIARHAQTYDAAHSNQVSLRSLTDIQRYEILATAYREWQELMAALPAELTLPSTHPKRVLLYRNVGELFAAYDAYPRLSHVRIAATFLRQPSSFYGTLDALTARISTPNIERSSQPELTNRELTLRARAKDTLAEKNGPCFSEALPVGETVYPETVEGIDDAIFSVLARMDQAATQMYGKPLRNVWRSGTIGKSTIARLQPKKFYGRLTHPRVVIMPIDDAFIDAYLRPLVDKEQIDRDSIMRLNAVVDMQSTGRGVIGQSILDVIVYTRDIADTEKRNHVLSIRGAASGQQVAAYLAAESSEIGKSILTHALQHPFMGGLVNPH